MRIPRLDLSAQQPLPRETGSDLFVAEKAAQSTRALPNKEVCILYSLAFQIRCRNSTVSSCILSTPLQPTRNAFFSAWSTTECKSRFQFSNCTAFTTGKPVLGLDSRVTTIFHEHHLTPATFPPLSCESGRFRPSFGRIWGIVQIKVVFTRSGMSIRTADKTYIGSSPDE